MKTRLLMILLLVIIPCVWGFQLPQGSDGDYVMQRDTSLPRLYERLYPASGSMDAFITTNPHVSTAGLEPGDEIVLTEPPPEFSTASLEDEQELWDAWQQYGVVRGFTFKTFVRHNLKRHGHTLPDTLKPFEIKPSWSQVYLASSFNRTEISSRRQHNREILSDAANVTDTRLIFLGDPYTENVRKNLKSRVSSSLEDDPGVDARYVVVDSSFLETGSLSLSAISENVYQEVFDTSKKEQVLFFIVKGRTVAVTYPQNSDLGAEDDSFFDELLSSIKDECAQGYGADTIFRVVREADERVKTRVHGG